LDAETQTPGIAEELSDARNSYPDGGAPVYRRPTPTNNAPEKALYERFQDLIASIKTAKDRIAELGPIVDWQRRTFPENYDHTLEERLDEWKSELRKHEDKWWELNYPDPARRAKEKLLRAFARLDQVGGRAEAGSRPKPPLPPGPPPPLGLIDPPETRELERRIRAEITESLRLNRTFANSYVGRRDDSRAQGPPPSQRKEERVSILNRLELPDNLTPIPLKPNPQVSDLTESQDPTQVTGTKGKGKEIEGAEGHPPHPAHCGVIECDP
jgi:hypothetical protein